MKIKLNRSKKINRQSLFFAVLLLLGTAQAVKAESDQSIRGKWEGTYLSKNAGLIALTLTLNDLRTGGHENDMLWSTPYNCKMKLEYVGLTQDEYILRIYGSNGGKCDTYRNGTLDLHLNSPHDLAFSLTSENGGLRVNGDLNRAQSDDHRLGLPGKSSYKDD